MKKTWKVPHIYVLLFLFIVLCGALTWVLPAGEFDRVTSEEGYSVVVPGTYHEIDPSPVGPFDIIRAVYDGMVDAGNIVFFLFMVAELLIWFFLDLPLGPNSFVTFDIAAYGG